MFPTAVNRIALVNIWHNEGRSATKAAIAMALGSRVLVAREGHMPGA